MKIVLKALGIIAVFAILLTILERWYNMFYVGQLYDSIGAGFALIGWVSPVAAVVAAAIILYRIVKA